MSGTSHSTALITGASSGIGAAFARQLAARGYDLILVARRGERLSALAAELQGRYPISAEVLVADLSRPADLDRVVRRVSEMDGLDLLINNAGFGTTGKFAEIDLAKQIDMINLHVIASVRLCRAALPAMVAHHRGAIINVASISAFTPISGNATYSATKAYLVTFTESLRAELDGTGVRVQALCPGFTYSEFHDTSEFEEGHRASIPEVLWTSADKVAAASLKALERGQTVYIPGFRNRLLVTLVHSRITSLLPSRMLRKLLRGKR